MLETKRELKMFVFISKYKNELKLYSMGTGRNFFALTDHLVIRLLFNHTMQGNLLSRLSYLCSSNILLRSKYLTSYTSRPNNKNLIYIHTYWS